MKQFVRTLAAGALLACSPLVSAEFSGNAALATDYVFRGISQTNEDPAIQGGFDFKHDSGFYAGVWASNVDLGFGSNIEIDYYAGLTGALAGGLGWDAGLIYYSYPGSDDDDAELDYWEVKGGLNYAFKGVALEPTVGLTLFYSPEFTGETGDAVFVLGSLSLSLPQDFGLSAHVGQQTIDDYNPDSYLEYGVGISKAIAGFNLGLTYYATDDDAEELFADLADERVVFSVARSF